MSTEPVPLPVRVRDRVAALAAEGASALPAYVYDLTTLATHAAAVRRALPTAVGLLYAAKANPDGPILRTLAPRVDGFEVASAGELGHVHASVPTAALAFGGPGKSERDLESALEAAVDRIHVESPHELRLLAAVSRRLGVRTRVLLRVNLPVRLPQVSLTMSGPSPFGMDPDALDACLDIADSTPGLEVTGIHCHAASGLDAAAQLALAEQIVSWATAWAAGRGRRLAEVNLGGGMAVDYGRPTTRFDWGAYGRGLARIAADAPDLTLRIEPGRAMSAYAGWYAASVLDVKRSGGRVFAVLAGGTHHLRTPVAKGHDQPFTVVGVDRWPHPWPRPAAGSEPVTLVGQLCTPKDVLARGVPVAAVRAGDVVAFALAGAYAWNISHHDFLMHPPPAFHHLGGHCDGGPAGQARASVNASTMARAVSGDA